MNKHIFSSFLVIAGICLTMLSSCNQDAEGEIWSGELGYSFPSSTLIKEVTSNDNGVVSVPIYRTSKKGESTISIDIDDDTKAEGIFSLESNDVSFADGEGVAYAKLKFASINDLGATSKYVIGINFADGINLSPASEEKIEVTVSRKLTWKSIGTGVYTSELFGQGWDQEVQKADEGNIYRLPDCISSGYPLIFSLSEDGQTLLGWDIQPIGYNTSSYGMLYYKATKMTREGNILSFTMNGLVKYNGGWGKLYSGFTETLEMPN